MEIEYRKLDHGMKKAEILESKRRRMFCIKHSVTIPSCEVKNFFSLMELKERKDSEQNVNS